MLGYANSVCAFVDGHDVTGMDCNDDMGNGTMDHERTQESHRSQFLVCDSMLQTGAN
jgi:hypothetical protein